MNTNRISGSQLVLLLILCRSFNMLTADMHNVTGHYGMEQLAAIPLSLVLQAVIALPAFLLMRKTGRGMTESALWTAGNAGRIFPLVSCAYLAAVTGITIFNLASFLANAIYPGSSAFFLAAALTAAAFAAVYMGLEGLARAAGILFIFFLVSLLLTTVGVSERIRLLNIRPLETGSLSVIWQGAWKIFARSSTVFLFVLLVPQISRNKAKSFLVYLGAVGLMMEAVSFLVTTVLGELGVDEAYPFFMLTTIAQISIFQRMDALHVSIWVMVCFLRVTLFLWVMREQLRSILSSGFRESGRGRWILPFFSLLSVSLAAVMLRSRKFADMMLDILSTGVADVLLMAVLPAVFLITGAFRGVFRSRKGEGSE